ncbi:MAG: hypothetical protein GX430_13580 [Treponema sp.]|nr:hypothetical protein [Treponema sp.]
MTVSTLFDEAERKIRKDFLSGRERDRYLARLDSLRRRYAVLGEIDEAGGVAMGLIERGERLLAGSPLRSAALEGFLRHAGAAWYDLSGRLGAYRWYVRCFFAAAISFFVLAPQFFPAILPLIFIVPVFLGLRGLRSRSVNGFTLSAMIFPVSLLAGTTGARFFVPALGRLSEASAEMAARYPPLPTSAGSFLITTFAILSLLGIASSLAGAAIGFRRRDMFV